MGLSLSKLVEENRTFIVKFDEGDMLITYKPNMLSSAQMQKLQDEVDEDDANGMAILFCSIVTEWDLEGPLGEGEHAVAAGEVVPLKPEIVSWIPTSVLRVILEEIGEDASPKRNKRASSRR